VEQPGTTIIRVCAYYAVGGAGERWVTGEESAARKYVIRPKCRTKKAFSVPGLSGPMAVVPATAALPTRDPIHHPPEHGRVGNTDLALPLTDGVKRPANKSR